MAGGPKEPFLLDGPKRAHAELILPDPEIAERWAKLIPSAPTDLWHVFKTASESRLKDEETLRDIARASSRRETLGQVTGFIVIITGLVIAGGLIYVGKSAEGLAMVLSPLGIVAGVLVVYRKSARPSKNSQHTES